MSQRQPNEQPKQKQKSKHKQKQELVAQQKAQSQHQSQPPNQESQQNSQSPAPPQSHKHSQTQQSLTQHGSTQTTSVITQQPRSEAHKHAHKCEAKSHEQSDDSTSVDRCYVFHRNRELAAPDPNDSPINRIKFYLDKYKIKEASQVFFHDNTLKLLADEPDFMWDIIPLICQRLRGLCQYRFRVFEGCERMLHRIAKHEACNPKEVLISLLAEIGQSKNMEDDNVFRAMIRPLEGALLRMSVPKPREENFSWTLEVLMRHIHEIELPKDYDIEGKKRQSLPNDSSTRRFIEILPLTLNFIEQFELKSAWFDPSPMPVLTESQIDEVLNGELVDDDFMNEYDASIRCDIHESSVSALLHLMNRPFTFLDTTHHCRELAVTANRCLNVILRCTPNLFAPIYKRVANGQWAKDSPDGFTPIKYFGANDDPELTLATCAYIYRCEFDMTYPFHLMNARVDKFPQILTHQSLLYCHTSYIVALLKRTEILAHEKGLCLLDVLLMNIGPNTLDHRFLSLFKTSTLLKRLFQIMVFSPHFENRRRAYTLFTRIGDSLTMDCKADLFSWVLNQSNLKVGIRAACIDQYRKHLTIIYQRLHEYHQQLSKADLDPAESNMASRQIELWQSHYRAMGGRELVEFLDLCIKACLPDSQNTYIIQNYDLLLATLTIFRYLKMRRQIVKCEDEDEYLCGARLKKSLFEPIRTAISMILAELKLHHKELVEGYSSRANVGPLKPGPEFLESLVDKQLNLEPPPRSYECEKVQPKIQDVDGVKCLDWILCRLDFVESLLVKTCDLYNC